MAPGSGPTYQNGKTSVIMPDGVHKATVVWLHDLSQNGSRSSQLLKGFQVPNVKWICVTAPPRPLKIFGGFPTTAWFDMAELSEDCPEDFEGLDATASFVANFLSTELNKQNHDIKLCIGGFGMGAAVALYSAACFALKKYNDGRPYTVNLGAVFALNGWLPDARGFETKLKKSIEAIGRLASLPILISHGLDNQMVPPLHAERAFSALRLGGRVEQKTYDGVGHTDDKSEVVTSEISTWLNAQI